jgi:hypothetical protein
MSAGRGSGGRDIWRRIDPGGPDFGCAGVFLLRSAYPLRHLGGFYDSKEALATISKRNIVSHYELMISYNDVMLIPDSLSREKWLV